MSLTPSQSRELASARQVRGPEEMYALGPDALGPCAHMEGDRREFSVCFLVRRLGPTLGVGEVRMGSCCGAQELPAVLLAHGFLVLAIGR
jgi:hypothetical protein